MRKIIFVAVAVLFSWNTASAQIPPIERDALIALYNSTNGATWSDSTNWLGTAGTECDWHGVSCSGGRVWALYLQSNELSGSIPPEFGDLSGLIVVYLFSNHLDGNIPPQLGNLTSLQDLWLNSNELSGSIPPELGSMTALTALFLSDNQLTGGIPSEFGDLSNLTALSLTRNQMTGSIPLEFENLSNLQNLYLRDNQLSGSIPPELGNLPNLMALDLATNQFSGGIPPELGGLSTLQFLNLDGNPLGGGIPPELETLSSLQSLGLFATELSGSIPPELGNLESLTSLILTSNHLRGPIPAELGDLANLETLRLERNLLSGAIPSALGNLSNLRNLFVNANPLGGPIPPQLGDLSSLEYLRLNGTQLSGSVPPELVNLTALQDGNGLDLRFDALHSDDAVLVAFLNQKQINGDWQAFQTVAPENVSVEWAGDHTVWLSWDAVSFQGYSGGYEAFFSPAATGQWVSAGKTASKTELNIPITNLDAGAVYDFAVASYTLPSVHNPNTVTSDLGELVMATTADTGCAAPAIDLAWGDPAVLSLTSGYDSYLWSTGETGPTILVDPNNPRFYWVTVTSSGPCQESAIELVDPLFFSDGFESGGVGGWSSAVPVPLKVRTSTVRG